MARSLRVCVFGEETSGSMLINLALNYRNCRLLNIVRSTEVWSI